jgi:hypothetical protein
MTSLNAALITFSTSSADWNVSLQESFHTGEQLGARLKYRGCRTIPVPATDAFSWWNSQILKDEGVHSRANSFLQMAKKVSLCGLVDFTLFWNELMGNDILAVKTHFQHHLPI